MPWQSTRRRVLAYFHCAAGATPAYAERCRSPDLPVDTLSTKLAARVADLHSHVRAPWLCAPPRRRAAPRRAAERSRFAMSSQRENLSLRPRDGQNRKYADGRGIR